MSSSGCDIDLESAVRTQYSNSNHSIIAGSKITDWSESGGYTIEWEDGEVEVDGTFMCSSTSILFVCA